MGPRTSCTEDGEEEEAPLLLGVTSVSPLLLLLQTSNLTQPSLRLLPPLGSSLRRSLWAAYGTLAPLRMLLCGREELLCRGAHRLALFFA